MNNNPLFAILIALLGGFIVAAQVTEFRHAFMVLKNGES